MVALTRENSDDFRCRTYDTVNRSCTGIWQCLDHPESETRLCQFTSYRRMIYYIESTCNCIYMNGIHGKKKFIQTVDFFSASWDGLQLGVYSDPKRGVTGGLW